MGRKSPKSQSEAARPVSTALGGQNGSANGSMESHLEMRRKHPVLESPGRDSQTAHLISREGFSLDNEVPPTPTSPNPNASFFDLPRQDRRNFLLLVLLYFLQGIPMGLAFGSVPFLLKPYLSYGQIGIFSLASYPYSLKLLWSPIVDAVWSPKVGRRKSWILPIQMCSGFGMLYLGGQIKDMMVAAGKSDGSGVWNFTGWWFFLVFLCATQDIAVDGWALTLLSPPNLSYASTAQTVGLTAGNFLSATVFLALNAPEFANRWFRSSPRPEGVITLSGYLTFWGWAYLAVTLGLAVLKREDSTKERDGIVEVYKSMLGVLKLKNIQSIIIIHLIAKIGFQANDAVTNLKLIDKGFSQEDLALTVLIDFPFEISLGYIAGRWSTTNPPIHVWCWAFIGRLIAAVVAQVVVMVFPKEGVQGWYLLTVIASHIFSTFTSTVMFVAISAFHARIADPAIGGTYMTLLATVSNLGGTFPKIFVLRLVDAFTIATCTPPSTPPKLADLKGALITSSFSCVAEAEKHRCIDGGGTCVIQRDGYYITNVAGGIEVANAAIASLEPKSMLIKITVTTCTLHPVSIICKSVKGFILDPPIPHPRTPQQMMPTPAPSSTSQSPHSSHPSSAATSPPSPPHQTPTPDDDVFASSPTEPSDIPRLRSTHTTSGYRAGITASKESTLQHGFDEGYTLGAEFGLRVGWVIGVLEGLHTALLKWARQGEGSNVGRKVEGKNGNEEWVSMAEERERVGRMLREAREGLRVERVFGREWWKGDGSWGYEVLGEAVGEGEGKGDVSAKERGEVSEERKGEEEVPGRGWGKGEVTFKEVVEGHPVVREWVGRVRREMEKWGLSEDGGFGGAEWEAGRVEEVEWG